VGTVGITKALVMTTLQKALIGVTLAAALGTGLYQARRASDLQEQVEALRRQSAPADGQSDSLRRQLEETDRQLSALHAQNEELRRDAADGGSVTTRPFLTTPEQQAALQKAIKRRLK